MEYCIYNPAKDKFYTGDTKEELINQICKITFTDENRLSVEVDGYKTTNFHSYNPNEFTKEEMYKDAVNFTYDNLRSVYKCTFFKAI